MDRLVGGNPEIVKAVTKAIPLQRYGKISEIADAGLFLFSPAAAYVTGGVLIVDGGDVSLISSEGFSVKLRTDFVWQQYHTSSVGAMVPYPEFLFGDGDQRATIASKL